MERDEWIEAREMAVRKSIEVLVHKRTFTHRAESPAGAVRVWTCSAQLLISASSVCPPLRPQAQANRGSIWSGNGKEKDAELEVGREVLLGNVDQNIPKRAHSRAELRTPTWEPFWIQSGLMKISLSLSLSFDLGKTTRHEEQRR